MDKDALKGKSLAQLREIGRSMGIKAQLRKQDLIDRIVALSATVMSESAPAETAKPETKTPAVDSAAKEGKTAAASESRQTEKPAAAPKSAAPATKQAPKSEAKPAAADSGRAFTVQIMASSTQLASDNACFGSQRGKVRRYTANGRYKYKYCVGRYTDRAEAQRAAASLRKEFNGAFVVEVENGSVVK